MVFTTLDVTGVGFTFSGSPFESVARQAMRERRGSRHARMGGSRGRIQVSREESHQLIACKRVGTMRVSELNCYPVKGCRGTALLEAKVGPRGMEGDRSFMLVDDDGCFITQRSHPRMALIEPRLADDSLSLSAPDAGTLSVPVLRNGERRRVVVWRDCCEAIDQGDAAAEWASSFLGTSCRLVRMADDFVRRVDPEYAVSDGDQVGFADGYPFLLTTEESLADLNARMAVPLPMNRFRPSIVVAGAEPFAEDGWRRVRIGAIVFAVVKPCARCVVTTTDQATAERGIEPLHTLASFRTVPGRGIMFGQNLIQESTGVIRVGDAVELLG